MNIRAKSVLAGMAVIAVIAVSAAPSEAAKRKAAKMRSGSNMQRQLQGQHLRGPSRRHRRQDLPALPAARLRERRLPAGLLNRAAGAGVHLAKVWRAAKPLRCALV
jgi:hypothetical protein